MIPAVRSEFRKLLSVRSTYFIVIASLLIVIFFAAFIEVFHGSKGNLLNPTELAGESTSAIGFVGFILSFAGILLAGHEYRYTTIMYTLTASNRRLKVLAAKFIVITIFAVITSLLITFFSPLCTIVAAHLAGKQISPQTFVIWSVVWRCVLCGWGYAMYGFILLMILRNQIGAIVTFLIVPLIGEGLLSLLLKNNTIYLPFTAVQGIALPGGLSGHVTSLHEAGVTSVYIVAGLIISSFLFLKRDAN